MKQKAQLLQEKITEAEALVELMDSDDAENTVENQEKYDGYVRDIRELKTAIENDAVIKGAKDLLVLPANGGSKTAGLFSPAGGDGAQAEAFAGLMEVFELGDTFVELEAYKAGLAAGIPRGTEVRMETKGFLSRKMILQQFERMQRKATFSSSGLTSIQRVPGIANLAELRLTVADLLSSGQTNATTIRYMQETAFTNAATTVAEGTAKPEATFTVAEKDAPVRKIAVTSKVTDELFKDYPAMRDYVNNRLRYMVQLYEEFQFIQGLGTGSDLTGILNTSGIQTTASAKATAIEDIYKAGNKIRNVAYVEPDGIVMNPADYETARLAKDAHLQYFGGGPWQNEYGVGGYPVNPPLWGLPVVVTPNIPAGTALVGAFRIGAQAFYREGIMLDMTNSNVDDFVKNLLTIRCEERVALAVYRPKAFCSLTGINV